jgi:hypothetical protein
MNILLAVGETEGAVAGPVGMTGTEVSSLINLMQLLNFLISKVNDIVKVA